MPIPQATNTVEFGWTGSDGYIRNGGKYNLLTDKPAMSFAYDVVMYSTDPLITSNRIIEGAVFPLQPNEMTELHDYAIANSVDDPWNPPPLPEFKGVIQSLEAVDLVGLSGKGFTQTRSVLTRTLVAEHSGTPAVYHRLTVLGTFDVTTGIIPLAMTGLFSEGQYAFINSMLADGSPIDPADSSGFTVHTNLEKQRTNDLEVRVSLNGDGIAEGHLQAVVEFVLPNEDYGLGVPFPDYK